MAPRLGSKAAYNSPQNLRQSALRCTNSKRSESYLPYIAHLRHR